MSIAADALDLAGFEEPKEQRLHAQRHLADFVEEHRSAACALEQPALVTPRIGKAALHMTEQL